MGLSALPIVLIFLLIFLTWQTIYSANRDLVRAKAWEDLARRAMPFGALALMALSLFLVQQYRQGWVMITWMAVSGVLIVIASLFSVPALERRASKAFRQRDYQKAAEFYGELAEERPLARNHAFLGAALGASERFEESVEASTKAIKDDPKYGLAFYNRALSWGGGGKKGGEKKTKKTPRGAPPPRRFRTAVRKMLEEEKA